MREIGIGGFEGIKDLIEQNLFLDYGFIGDSIPNEYNLTYYDLNDEGKIIVLNEIISNYSRLNVKVLGKSRDFEDFDWKKSLLTEYSDIFNDFEYDIESEINNWYCNLERDQIMPFKYSISDNQLMSDCLLLFHDLVNDLEIDPAGRDKICKNIFLKLQECIAYNAEFLATNFENKDDIYLLTEKITLLYQSALTNIQSKFPQYLNSLDSSFLETSNLSKSYSIPLKTVFGMNYDFIEKMHQYLLDDGFINKSCTKEDFLLHFGIENNSKSRILLIGKNLSDIGFLIDSLRQFFKEDCQNKTFFNTFWAERFMFQTNHNSHKLKIKTPNEISKIISDVKNSYRSAQKKHTINNIVQNLKAFPQ